MKIKLLVFILFLAFKQSSSQKFEMNFAFDPLVQRLGNLSKQYVAISNGNKQLSSNSLHRTNVVFYNVTGRQFNGNVLFKRPLVLIGFDLNYFQHSYQFDVIFGYSIAAREIISNNIGGSFLLGKDFNNFRTRVLLGIETTYSFEKKENIGVPINYGNQSADMKEEFFGNPSIYFTPKIIYNTKISRNIFLNYGFRLKFIDRQFFKMYSFKVQENEDIYLDFSLNSRQFHFFFGVGFTLNPKK